jgi:hypothetical protein
MKINRKERQLISDILSYCRTDNVETLWKLQMKLENSGVNSDCSRVHFIKTDKHRETKRYDMDRKAYIDIVIE